MNNKNIEGNKENKSRELWNTVPWHILTLTKTSDLRGKKRTATKSWALYGRSVFQRAKGLKIFYVYSMQSKCIDVGIKVSVWRDINICVQTCCKFSALFQKLGYCTRRYQWTVKVRNVWYWIIFEIYIYTYMHTYISFIHLLNRLTAILLQQ